jgi:hypothetical protein
LPGLFSSLARLIAKKPWAHWIRYTEWCAKAEDEEITHAFAELFYPEPLEWRQAVSRQFQEVLSRALTNQKVLK